MVHIVNVLSVPAFLGLFSFSLPTSCISLFELVAFIASQVVITQPRKVAAESLAQHVAEEWGCDVGQVIGYEVGGSSKTSRNTQVVFCTDQVRVSYSCGGISFVLLQHCDNSRRKLYTIHTIEF